MSAPAGADESAASSPSLDASFVVAISAAAESWSVITERSQHGYVETTTRLLEAITRRGLTVFARIDHAAGARQVGMELPPEEVVIFGNPRAGTQLMQRDPRVGLDLPLRIVLWEGTYGVSLGYEDPRELAGQYDLAAGKSTLDSMAALLEVLVGEAAG
jgi:uncharacterized protein (DUF302 family)